MSRQPTMKSLEKDLRAKHSITAKYPSGKILSQEEVVKALAETDQKVRKKKQLSTQAILSFLEMSDPSRWGLGSLRIKKESETERLVISCWQNGRIEAVFKVCKTESGWIGKRIDLLEMG